MDNFISIYVWLLVIALISLVLFWGGIVYFFFRSTSGLSTQQKVGFLSWLLGFFSGRGSSQDLMDSKVGGVAASEGIDLNNNR